MMDILWKIAERIQNYEKFPLLIAVDGRCAAGKTTLAAALREGTGCQVIHRDDFCLRPGKGRLLEKLEKFVEISGRGIYAVR